jgi:uncharacterized protein (DUF305 family)
MKEDGSMGHAGHAKWTRLAIMAVLSFVVMYVLMYMMVATFGDVLSNVNEFYMAAAMTAAMVLIEIAVMHDMYEKKVRITSAILGIIGLVAFVGAVRIQFAVSDKQFLKSMIPHHSAALLMCKQTDLKDPEIKSLCERIITGQQAEIDWMKSKLSTVKH